MRVVGQPVRKKDAMSLVTGKPVYMDDLAPKDCLIVKVLRSPHANAIVEEVNTKIAMKVPGIEAIYTWEDVPKHRFAQAGQTYPEWSPYDRLILDQHVRFVGDAVAIIAGEDEACVDRAMKMIKVKYKVLPAVLDYHKAKDNEVLVHPEDNWESKFPVGADNKRNLCAHMEDSDGDLEKTFADCDIVLERTYHVPAVNQAMMETFRTTCYLDTYGRLVVFSSTQIVYHVRRIIANALGIPKHKVRALKPRIGGGFGAKQTVVTEIFPAFVTWMTKKPSKIIYTREESQIAGSPRHEMEVTVKIGANKDGTLRAFDLYNLSNTGAYGDHGPTTAGLTGHKSLPMYTANMEAFRHTFDVVYTNVLAAGAYRGYGATQGIFALESIVNELASILHMDPVELRLKNVVRQGMTMQAYSNEVARGCRLDDCLVRAAEMIGWKEKYPVKDMGNGKVRSVGIAMAMQGSCISYVDVGSATIMMNEDGSYRLAIAAADMGTGCDTILAQMAAECLGVSTDEIFVSGADTDTSPYDSGSYASSTTYVTGQAVVKASTELEKRIRKLASQMLECEIEDVEFDGKQARDIKTGKSVTAEEIGYKAQCFNDFALQVTESYTSPVSPPPYMAGAVEIELDKETGHLEILNYAAVVDCGTVVNPNLARVQVEGGLGQGIGMALYENIQYSDHGKLYNNSLMQYKIPTRLDMGNLHVEFKPSYEPTGPFGVKSIGEIVINTPAPALAHAIFNATGVWHRSLPITSEKIAMGVLKNREFL
ncbi:xanthine dehydrogenase family protein molybdopterin-binding subunit [Anaerostipes sp. MSJ-23]|uniref:xanthine dehydrogenase family protein molybdopterin-binding subunit n=1 Tax=Anaerostipes sp. MSJ-23 TaxID=2841520 RepID=UPI001C102CD6|nr:molybdopterin cofactor-binding domain-containing protein [Anaerostipes sp. MSJ-23]MBU5460675.1 molybdopterin-dependent oxidoreductase [Anaerostipes sp. MSJ-23]